MWRTHCTGEKGRNERARGSYRTKSRRGCEEREKRVWREREKEGKEEELEQGAHRLMNMGGERRSAFTGPHHVDKKLVARRFVDAVELKLSASVPNDPMNARTNGNGKSTKSSSVSNRMTKSGNGGVSIMEKEREVEIETLMKQAGFGTRSSEWNDTACRFFMSMPKQYVMDVAAQVMSGEGIEMVLRHMALVGQCARNEKELVFAVKEVVVVPEEEEFGENSNSSPGGGGGDEEKNSDELKRAGSLGPEDEEIMIVGSGGSGRSGDGTFGKTFSSSPNLVALHDLCVEEDQREEAVMMPANGGSGQGSGAKEHAPNAAAEGEVTPSIIKRYEITVAARDKADVLARILGGFSALELNVLEAHAFSTTERVALDVFMVSGWHKGGAVELEHALHRASLKRQSDDSPRARSEQHSLLEGVMTGKNKAEWHVDAAELRIGRRFASGSYGDLYLGEYHGRSVAVKVIRAAAASAASMKEFDHEVGIMHTLQHPNIVAFIGSCATQNDNMIISEYMAGGSCYAHLRSINNGRGLRINTVLSYCTQVCAALSYLHKKSIVHRDIKTANMLLNGDFSVIKLGDFGVARIVDDTVMTAETGTYRWMAPEVIEHQSYSIQADVYSFAIAIWEMITAQTPYGTLSAIQSAMAVVEKDLRPKIPSSVPPQLTKLMAKCWERNPKMRPTADELAPAFAELLTLREASTNSSAMSRPWRIFGKKKSSGRQSPGGAAARQPTNDSGVDHPMNGS